MEPKDTWRRFRLEAEAVKNYPMPYAMYIGQTHRDRLLEQTPQGVKLENGLTVQARIDDYVTLVLGDRTAFLEITTPLFALNIIGSTGI